MCSSALDYRQTTIFFTIGWLSSILIQVETWLQIAKKLMPGGRIIVNCGGAGVEESLSSSWVQNPTIKALCSAFPRQVMCI
jgi:hypothetical protein